MDKLKHIFLQEINQQNKITGCKIENNLYITWDKTPLPLIHNISLNTVLSKKIKLHIIS